MNGIIDRIRSRTIAAWQNLAQSLSSDKVDRLFSRAYSGLLSGTVAAIFASIFVAKVPAVIILVFVGYAFRPIPAPRVIKHLLMTNLVVSSLGVGSLVIGSPLVRDGFEYDQTGMMDPLQFTVASLCVGFAASGFVLYRIRSAAGRVANQESAKAKWWRVN